MSVNSLVIDGNLTADPDVRFTPSGTEIVSTRLAHNGPRKKRGEDWVKGDTYFFNLVCFGYQAKRMSRLSKGDSIVITSGRIAQESYEDKNGNKRQAFKIFVNGFERTKFINTKDQDYNDEGGYSGDYDAEGDSPL